MTTPTLRDTSQALINILKELHYGRMPERVQTAFDAVQEALAAQPELPEPVGHAAIADGKVLGTFKTLKDVQEAKEFAIGLGDKRSICIESVYTAAQLQQAVEQATAKSVESANEWQDVERLAANRYRPVPDGFSYKVAGGDGTRSLWHGTQDECRLFAAKLTEAFLDGAFIQRQQAQAKREPMPQEQLREIFLANGFTVKAGQDDLKDYVYAAGRAIEAHHGIGDK